MTPTATVPPFMVEVGPDQHGTILRRVVRDVPVADLEVAEPYARRMLDVVRELHPGRPDEYLAWILIAELVTGEHEERVYAEQCQRRGVLAL